MAATYDHVPIDDTFPRRYDIVWLRNRPFSKKGVYEVDWGGPVLEVYVDDEDPVVICVPGEAATLRLMTWPDPRSFLVMPAIFLINAADPARSYQIGFDGYSVHYVYPFGGAGVVIVGHSNGLACYDAAGLRWTSNGGFCCKDPIVDIAGEAVQLDVQRHTEPDGVLTRIHLSLADGTLLPAARMPSSDR